MDPRESLCAHEGARLRGPLGVLLSLENTSDTPSLWGRWTPKARGFPKPRTMIFALRCVNTPLHQRTTCWRALAHHVAYADRESRASAKKPSYRQASEEVVAVGLQLGGLLLFDFELRLDFRNRVFGGGQDLGDQAVEGLLVLLLDREFCCP